MSHLDASQAIAVFLVVFGAVCMAVASHYNWPEMKTLGASISGAGIQAIVSQYRQSVKNTDGGTINVNPTTAQPGQA